MRSRASVDVFCASLFAALGIAAAPGCDASPSDPSYPCINPQPIVVLGKDSGYDMCAGGFTQRRVAVTCPSALPRVTMCASSDPTTDMCTSDADCSSKPNGFCSLGNFGNGPGGGGCSCQFGCITDADCGAGSICKCDDPVGSCVPAKCTSAADCGGVPCSTYITVPGCGTTAFACQTEDDACASDADCGANAQCTLNTSGSRVCEDISCVIGRPFLVSGLARHADAAPRRDWIASNVSPSLEGLSPPLRRELCDRWTRVGLMEHASIAAFARFTLHLLQMAAPPGLVRGSQDAMGDETEHALLCFALASAYGGARVGPGALPIAGSLDETDPRRIIAMLIREGCIGETVAAIEAAEGRERAADPEVREVLATIARDEGRHAELAWRTVSWALERGDRVVREAVRAELQRAIREEGSPILAENGAEGFSEDELLEHGIVGARLRSELHAAAMDRVFRPAARSLLARHDERAAHCAA